MPALPFLQEDGVSTEPFGGSLGLQSSFGEEGAEDAEHESQPLAGESLFTALSASSERKRRDVEEEARRLKELEEYCEKRQKVRLALADAVDGNPDWLLDASSLVDELYQALGQRSLGLQRLRTVIEEAAKKLNDDEWEQFRRMPFEAVHREDAKVFSRLVADAEPHWKRLMEDLGRGFSNIQRETITRDFLYIGLTEPSDEMVDFFQGRGWNMHRAPPELPKPLDKKAGDEDGPEGYQLVIVDLTFPCATQGDAERRWVEEKQESDDDAVEVLHEGSGSRTAQEKMDACHFSEDFVCDMLQEVPDAWQVQAHLSGLPLKASGYGKIGISRSNGVRRRLRTIQGALAEALRNLQKGGVLVTSWCGLPTHPLLPFVTRQLRPGFRRVHVLAPPECQTFETYIVAAEYDCDGHISRPDPVPLRPRQSQNLLLNLGPAEMCKFNFPNWLRSPVRSWSTGYDDALAWTLSFKREIFEECLPKYKESVVNDVRTDAAYDRPWLTKMPANSHVARSAPLDMEARFDELWSIYAHKLGLLMNRLEENSFDPDILPDRPPHRFNATTSWTMPRPALPPPEPVMLPQRKQTEEVPEERSKSKGSKSKPSKSRSRSKEPGSKDKRSKSKESRSKSKTSRSLPAEKSSSQSMPSVNNSASGTSTSATPPTQSTSLVLEQPRSTSRELPDKPKEPASPTAQRTPAISKDTAAGPSKDDSSPAPDSVPGPDPAWQEETQDETSPSQANVAEGIPEEVAQPVKRQTVRPQVAGRPQCTMWMSSTLGAAPGMGPDPVALTNSSSWLSAALEKIPTFYAREALPTLYRRPWPKASQRSPYEQANFSSPCTSRPCSAATGIGSQAASARRIPPDRGRRPSTTSGQRKKADVPV
ncbi:tubd1 [Symbiodinium pilosum]|uniref:Tubd1 protein n=1 Tax=Symbiodinium pilosum TaxID=2952 RepID=A0A812K6F5_SYMPI|nr:tubd1 [Symbiodinium pilosum]